MDPACGNQEPGPLSRDALEFFEELGRNLAAPLLAGMVHWIARQVETNPPDAILFFSRDGKILKTLWEENVGGRAARIPAHYVLASRRCLGIAGLDALDERALRFLTSHSGNLDVRALVSRTGLDPERFADLIAGREGLDLDMPVPRLPETRAKRIFTHLKQPLLELAAGERAAYRRYLESLGLKDMQNVAVVDIGWHGSLQHAFRRIFLELNAEVSICGYYAALFGDARQFRCEGNTMRAYLLEDGEPQERYLELRRFVEIMEFLFSAEEPGLLAFGLDVSGKPTPVFLPEERDPWQLAATRALHRGIRTASHAGPFDPDVLYERIRRTGLQPTRREAGYLGRLCAARGFGIPHQIKPLARKGQTLANLCHWRGFVQRFKEALWRPGFWAQLSPLERRLLIHLSPEGSLPYRG